MTVSRHAACRLTAWFPAFVAAFAAVLLLGAPAALATPPPDPAFTAPIDDYSPYQGQTTCASQPMPGTVAFQQMVLNAYHGLGGPGLLLRDCSQGGQSEHKDGRAWDWLVSTSDATEYAAAQEVLAWLTATDAAGNPNARLRRLGIMYMVYNRQIFKAYQAGSGWQPYTGSDPHTSHVHFSFGWAGARQQTSWWSGSRASAPARPLDDGAGAVSPAAGQLTTAVRDAGGGVVLQSWDSQQGLGQATDLGGAVVGAPALATAAPGPTPLSPPGLVAAQGTNGQAYVRVRPQGGSWGGWTSLGGALSGPPAAAYQPDGTVVVVAAGSDHAAWFRTGATDGTWSPWRSLGGRLLAGTTPAAAALPDGQVTVVLTGTDGATWWRDLAGSGGWQSLGGRTAGGPALAAVAADTLAVVVRGSDAGAWTQQLTAAGGAGSWTSLGGRLDSAPALATTPDLTRSDVVAVGSDGNLWERPVAAGSTWVRMD